MVCLKNSFISDSIIERIRINGQNRYYKRILGISKSSQKMVAWSDSIVFTPAQFSDCPGRGFRPGTVYLYAVLTPSAESIAPSGIQITTSEEIAASRQGGPRTDE
jgi:hypothetical protein